MLYFIKEQLLHWPSFKGGLYLEVAFNTGLFTLKCTKILMSEVLWKKWLFFFVVGVFVSIRTTYLTKVKFPWQPEFVGSSHFVLRVMRKSSIEVWHQFGYLTRIISVQCWFYLLQNCFSFFYLKIIIQRMSS